MNFSVDQLAKYLNKYIVKIIGVNSLGVTVLCEYDTAFQAEVGKEVASQAQSEQWGFDSKYIGMKIFRMNSTTAKERLTEYVKKFCPTCLDNS